MNEGPHVYTLDLTPENIRELVAEYEREKPDLGRRFTDRLTPYQIDRLPPGIVLVGCPVCGAAFSAFNVKGGDFALVAVFSFRAEKLPGARVVFTFPVCPLCAWKEAPALAAEVYPA